MFGECENTGLSIKCRPDGMLLDKKLKTATLMDIKTTINVSPTGFAKEIKNWNYGVQAVFYMKCCKSIGLNVDRFIFCRCKETGICTKHTLSELYLKYAEKQMFKAMAELLDAQISGKFKLAGLMKMLFICPAILKTKSWMKCRKVNMIHKLKKVKARYPKMNQPYIWSDADNRYIDARLMKLVLLLL